MEVTYYGHSCFMVTLNGKKILFDPFILPNEKASNVKIEDIIPDYIFVTHGHEDHVADVENIYKQSNAKVVGVFEVTTWFSKQGVDNVHGMNIGGSWDFDFGRVKMVNAVHSSVMPDGAYGGNPCGFVLRTEQKTIYYAGDTALHYDMKLIADEFDIDVAFLPIGSNFTMDIDDALRASGFVKAKRVIGMHYDTFPPIQIDHEKTLKAAEEANIELHLLKIGETKNF